VSKGRMFKEVLVHETPDSI
ncbi:hypothetical protein TCE0_033r09058, partial [Talaromyces pinophilus]